MTDTIDNTDTFEDTEKVVELKDPTQMELPLDGEAEIAPAEAVALEEELGQTHEVRITMSPGGLFHIKESEGTTPVMMLGMMEFALTQIKGQIMNDPILRFMVQMSQPAPVIPNPMVRG